MAGCVKTLDDIILLLMHRWPGFFCLLTSSMIFEKQYKAEGSK